MINVNQVFKTDMENHIKQDGLKKEVANNMYLAIMKDEVLMSNIIARSGKSDNGYNESFDGFSYIPSIDQLSEVMEDQKYDDVCLITHTIQTDKFSIHLLDAYQKHDDFLNYGSPRGEDTWHSLILCVGK